MKRMIKASSLYTEHMIIDHDGQKFSVNYRPDEYSGMVQAQITEIHPYDDAEYAWAKIIGPSARFYKDGKLIEDHVIDPFDEDEYLEDPEYADIPEDKLYDKYMNDVFHIVAAMLKYTNKNVKPIMVHN